MAVSFLHRLQNTIRFLHSVSGSNLRTFPLPQAGHISQLWLTLAVLQH